MLKIGDTVRILPKAPFAFSILCHDIENSNYIHFMDRYLGETGTITRIKIYKNVTWYTVCNYDWPALALQKVTQYVQSK